MCMYGGVTVFHTDVSKMSVVQTLPPLSRQFWRSFKCLHILQSAHVKEPGEEDAGSAGDSTSQFDPGSAGQAEDQLAVSHAASVTDEELQQVCDPRLDSNCVAE